MYRRRGARPALEQVGIMLMGDCEKPRRCCHDRCRGSHRILPDGRERMVPQPPRCQRENRKAPGDQVRNNFRQKRQNSGRACRQLY